QHEGHDFLAGLVVEPPRLLVRGVLGEDRLQLLERVVGMAAEVEVGRLLELLALRIVRRTLRAQRGRAGDEEHEREGGPGGAGSEGEHDERILLWRAAVTRDAIGPSARIGNCASTLGTTRTYDGAQIRAGILALRERASRRRLIESRRTRIIRAPRSSLS